MLKKRSLSLFVILILTLATMQSIAYHVAKTSLPQRITCKPTLPRSSKNKQCTYAIPKQSKEHDHKQREFDIRGI